MILNNQLLLELQQPISTESFCGSYLKLDRQAYRAIRNVYNEANSCARKLLQTPDENEVDELMELNLISQNKLAKSLIETLTLQTKDIELISWLMVSQVYLDNTLIGFKNAAQLLKFLVFNHWELLEPILPKTALKATDDIQVKKEIAEFKASSFSQMIGTSENDSILYAPLSLVPLIDKLSLFKYLSAEKKGECLKLKEELKKFVSEKKDTLIEKVHILNDIKQIFEEIYNFLNNLGINEGFSAPNFSFLINHLDKMIKVIEFMADIKIDANNQSQSQNLVSNEGEQIQLDEEVLVQSTKNQSDDMKNIDSNLLSNLNIQEKFNLMAKNNQLTREDIFEQLQNIANYFKSSEPHSPVSYLIEKAIRWGHMSLPELMTELMNEQHDLRNRIFTVAGLNEEDSNLISTNNVNNISNSANQESINW